MPKNKKRKVLRRKSNPPSLQEVDVFRKVETSFGPVQERTNQKSRIYHAWKVPNVSGSKLEIERESDKLWRVSDRSKTKAEFLVWFTESFGTPTTMLITDISTESNRGKIKELEGVAKIGVSGMEAVVHGKTMQQLITRMTTLLKQKYKIKFPLVSTADHESALTTTTYVDDKAKEIHS